jgi:hypothetical protein
LRGVKRVWRAHDLQSFKRSKDLDLFAKLEDIVLLYVDPPRYAVVRPIGDL